MTTIALFASSGVFSNAFAQEKTRAEVRQELIQAENNGSRLVTDTSYPEVNPIYTQQAAQLKQQSDTGVGAAMTGTHSSGERMAMPGTAAAAACVGPVSFCTPYFGS
ncbi:DUF4148 domain-containing protein [Paraburkholderia sp. DHOC27]|uniref:DUF4148 domain-containing protein n=1 Tax=Paraburkholderia sp. DHOC27 TaxID=2303330 RepID=UPI003857421F